MMEERGGKVMSAIMLTLGTDFAILCGETKFCLDTGEVERIKKVHMVKDKLLYGFTGRNTSAMDFFGKLIDENLEPTSSFDELTFEQLIDILDARFEFYRKHGVENSFDTYAVVCGPIGNQIWCIEYQIKQNECKRTPYLAENDILLVGSFLEKHQDNYSINFNAEDIVDEIVNAFQRMINKGINFDKTINNEVVAYFINRGIESAYITQRLR